jgi:hypothetical protein
VKEYDATVQRLTDERAALPSGAGPPDDVQTYVTAISELEARRRRRTPRAGSRTPVRPCASRHSGRQRALEWLRLRAVTTHARSPALGSAALS